MRFNRGGTKYRQKLSADRLDEVEEGGENGDVGSPPLALLPDVLGPDGLQGPHPPGGLVGGVEGWMGGEWFSE